MEMEERLRLGTEGHLILRGILGAADLASLRTEAATLASGGGPPRGGWRGVLAKSELFRRLATEGGPALIARAVLGDAARARKATLFDKTPGANWKVPWHQDLAIAVAERREVPGFTGWSVKEGVHHVQPPAAILEQVLAVRIHLDDAGEDNGALRVLPGSHRHGRLDDEQTARLRAEIEEVTCTVAAGDLHLFHPLLLHASSAATSAAHRRVLHLEYAAVELPAGLAWAAI